MKTLLRFIVFTVLVFQMGCSITPGDKAFKINVQLGEFGAFYTKLNSGQEFEKYSRTGDYADIVVDLGKDSALFVFWRGSSFLPFLQTHKGKWYVDELVKRKGDGMENMPDRTNAYSVVKLIESSPKQVVVHWRYLPEFTRFNPQVGPSHDKFVDEYYYIKPDGRVERTIKKGTKRIDEWRNPANYSEQTFTLTAEGITEKDLKNPGPMKSPETISGNPVISKTVVSPVAWWKFDEAIANETFESVSNTGSEIIGNKSLWRKGVSGTSLQFDGYFSNISLPAARGPKPTNAISLEGWLAIGAYPWSDVPLIQQADDVPEELEGKSGHESFLRGEEGREEMDDENNSDFGFVMKKEDDRGYFLGINGYGNPKFKIRVGNQWEELETDFHLDRRTWYHLAATYDRESGKMIVYIDGKKVGEKSVAKSDIELSIKDIIIGKGKHRRPIKPVRDNTFSDSYSFDGLIDEIKIYDVALSAGQIKRSYELFAGNKEIFSDVDMDKRVLPAGENRGEFGAYYTHLKFYDIWDNLWRFSEHPDVVVEFEALPTKFVFWRGVGYIPMLVNEKGQWYSNEFNETWNRSGGEGCQEPMSDKESYNNHARIIENTPARTVVQWRYPLIDVRHVMANFDEKTGWCDWSDWYYYIYPDGIAVKTMQLWTHGEMDHEWQESMAIFGPDQHPEQIIHTKGALTMLNLDDEYKTYDWIDGPPPNVEEPVGKCIQYINYTGKYKPVTIGDFEWSDVYSGEVTPYAVFPTWNHWPVGQMPSDGRYAIFPDRTAHSSLTHVPPRIYKKDTGSPAPYYKKILMEAMLDISPQETVKLARSWMQAPKLTETKGASGEYEPGQRAYLLLKTADVISFTLDGSKKSPVLNPCFVIKNWGDRSEAKIVVNGKTGDIKQGVIRDTDGSYTVVIWVKKETTGPVSLEIST